MQKKKNKSNECSRITELQKQDSNNTLALLSTLKAYTKNAFGPAISQAKRIFLNKIVESVPFEKNGNLKTWKNSRFQNIGKGVLFKRF
jgi:hypothetical protein